MLPIYALLITGMKSFEEVNLYRMWDLPAKFSLESFTTAWFGSEGQG
ncbi:MAG: carbohydrate ABC transporter permease, partial [Armatimonadetes bacterium]|nr:carbohydrate ABC transporter permease [Armatimonadota bacterium]